LLALLLLRLLVLVSRAAHRLGAPGRPTFPCRCWARGRPSTPYVRVATPSRQDSRHPTCKSAYFTTRSRSNG